MLIFRGGNWPEHRPWFLWCTVVSVAALAWFGVEWYRSAALPGGSSAPGFAYGIVGGVIITFEMLLWPRKKLRNLRVGRTKVWMKAHIWLGLLCLPLLILHSGFHWWNLELSGVLMAIFFIVIASGVVGLVLQHVLPVMMLEELPAETIRSQIDRVKGQLLDEARRLVRVTCGQPERGMTEADMGVMSQADQTFMVIGAVRTAGKVQGKVLQTRTQAMMVLNSEPLLMFFEENIVPFFEAKTFSHLPLGSSNKSAVMFRELKTFLNPDAHGVVDTLESICDQRRQFGRQAKLHSWLHNWILVHLPLSVVLFVLMVLHIFYALKYF